MEEILRLREAFHRHPELGNREERTAAQIEAALQSWGIETCRPFGTAVVGTLKGARSGKAVALRADMDALPVQETTGCPFASETAGQMHACGHDVHMAAALGAAKLLARERESLCGTVKFFFQPDEEGSGGAQRMIAAGCMEGVDAVFGAHVAPDLPEGVIGIRFGKFYAASDVFDLRVIGKSAHGAAPEQGIDALAAAAELVCRLKALPKGFPDERSVVTVGTLSAGTARNILAGEAVMSGIMRTLGADTRAEMKRRLLAVCRQLERESGVSVETEIRGSYPGIVNEDGMTALARRAAEERFGAARVRVITEPTMTTEDFGYFLACAPGCFYHIGTGGEYPLHNSAFLPSAEAVRTATEMHLAVLRSYLGENT